jgi:uncharacterized protein (TIGR00251 family)
VSARAARLKVKVVPGASRTEIVGRLGEALKVRVAAPPEGGQANREVVALLAARVGLPLAAVSVVSGLTSASKVVAFQGLDEVALRARLPF